MQSSLAFAMDAGQAGPALQLTRPKLVFRTELALGQQLAKRPAGNGLELSRTYRAIVVWISSLKPLFDHPKKLVLAQRAVVVWIGCRELLLRQATVQFFEIEGAILVSI
jgi:hypothetical protein